MNAPAPARRDRLRAMLADLKMPGALEAVDGILSDADGGTPARGGASGQRRRAGLPAASPEGRPRGPVERSRLRQLARGVPLRGRRGRGHGPDRLPLTEGGR